MDGAAWLDDIVSRIAEKLRDIEISRADVETVALTMGVRGVVIHTMGMQALLAPSVASERSLASRLQDRVKHLDMQQFAVSASTIDVAVEAVLSHLSG